MKLSARTDPTAAASVLQDLCPSEPARMAWAELVADSIRVASAVSPASWELTVFPNLVRLNVGQIAVLELWAQSVTLYVYGDVGREAGPGYRQYTKWIEYSAVPGPNQRWRISLAALRRLSPEFRSAHHRLVELAASKKPRSPFMRSHSPGMVAVIEGLLDSHLPHPLEARLKDETPFASPRFLDALDYAVRLHGNDVRKGSPVPYVAHLLSVCSLVLTDGGSEDEAIAALLHDVLEDHPQETSPDIISDRFGRNVLDIVQACTDTPPDYKGGLKPPWRQRKISYIEHVRTASASTRRVALADKLDNARSTLVDYQRLGESLWTRFNAGKDEQLWFYRSLVQAFREAGASGTMIEELDTTVTELERAR